MALWGLLAIVVLGTVGGALARFGWPFEVFASLLPQIAALGVISAVMMSRIARFELALLCAVAAAIAFWMARDTFARSESPMNERTVRLIWPNVLDREASFQKVVALAHRQNADIIVIGEYPNLPRLHDVPGFPHRAGEMFDGTVKVAVFSRLPISEISPFGPTSRPKRQGVAMTVVTSAGPIRLVALHPSVPLIPAMQSARDETVRLAFAKAQNVDSIVVGDFNTVPWSPVFAERGLLRRLPTGPTWMFDAPVLGLPIDHALVSGGLKGSASVGPGIGSDHFPLIIDILRETQAS